MNSGDAIALEFRLAEATEIPILDRLISRSVYGLQSEFYSKAQMDGAVGTMFAVDSQLIRDGTYFVVEHGDKIVACGGWSRRETLSGGDKSKRGGDEALLDPKKDAARIRAFFVDPDYARRGIGSEILQRCEAAIVEAGFTRACIVATLAGEKLYERFGYSVVKRSKLALPNGEGLPVVEMAKGLLGAEPPASRS